MKIAVFGGAGDMGSQTVEDLARTADVELVTIADKNVEAANALAARCASGGACVEVRRVDATSHDELVAAMRDHDVAASALGPFFRFEAPLARAAVEAGVSYASICDDWNAAEQVFDEVDAAARDAGVTVLTGLGASPGVTNVGIRYFADQLDSVRRADVSVYQPLNAGGGQAVYRHMLHIITGEVAMWRHGRREMVKACSEERSIEFPKFGRITVWNMGHAEPVSIPRFFPDIEEVNFFMGFGVGARAFVYPARLGLFGNPTIAEATVGLMGAIERLAPDAPPAPGAVRLDVWGERGGEEAHFMACGVGEMRATTGLSLSIGAQMLGRGEVLTEGGGVVAPEACLDPGAFLRHMRDKGIEAYEDLEMQRPLGGEAATEKRPAPRTRASGTAPGT